MVRRSVIIPLTTAILIVVILGAFGWATWLELTPNARDLATRLGSEAGENLVIAYILAVLVLTVVVYLMYRAYAMPLSEMAEQVRMIALSNPAHRLDDQGPYEMKDLVRAISLLADRYQKIGEDIDKRVEEAGAALKEERDTLATLTSKLSQGVVVCNLAGRVLLYNHQARRLLAGRVRGTGAGDWIGLGRSIYTLLDESLIRHALMTLVRGRQRGNAPAMVPFVAPRSSGGALYAHLLPISSRDRQWHGYILTLDDVSHRIAKEARRAHAFRRLIERQRAAIASIRASIETITAYPDMDRSGLQQFHTVIQDEALALSMGFDGLEDEVYTELGEHLPHQQVLASDFVATVERHVHDVVGLQIDVSVPVEPLRLEVDSYTLARCVIFLIGELRRVCDAESVVFTCQSKPPHALLTINWKGDPLQIEWLQSWGSKNISSDFASPSMTLLEVIDHHRGAIWAKPSGEDGKHHIHILLPLPDDTLLDGHESAEDDSADTSTFDFSQSPHAAHFADPSKVPLTDLSYTVLDTETTGLSPGQGDEIIAIGAVRIVNGRVLTQDVFDTFVNPDVPIKEESEAIHGITQSMLRGKPRIEEVLPDLCRFLEDSVIVGHNIDFDMRFFRNLEAKTGIKIINPVLDTLLLERLLSPNQQDKRLDAIAQRLGITATGRHTALGDALTTAEVFLALIPMLAEQNIRTFDQASMACKSVSASLKQF